ncbi:competence/damage-inducible protein A [Spongiimicrobium salis]|uniref:competence/damage-inducible protein A n=1 Tax=Spongiimicrobium salis TaxID=1667022 RepID=UPI00374CC032
MFAEIITIGDEILIGQIVDSNSAFIATELNKIGVSVYQITSIQDDASHIVQALREAETRADIIIITGGLGPTKDDITKHTLCTYFEDTLVENTAVLQHVEELFKKYIRSASISAVNRRQALVPSKAIALHNAYGTAPGIWIQKNEKVFVAMPGVPFEMKNLMTEQVIPRINTAFKRPHILHRTLMTYGVGESALAERIESWEDALPSFIKLAYLPNLGKVRLRLSARGADKAMITNAVEKAITELYAQIGDVIYGEEDEGGIEGAVARMLSERNKTLATAESFTGGKIAEQITAIPGASKYFKGSVVSYATATKVEVLKVPQALVDQYSVVSAEVAEAMAANVRELLKTDFAIATTGNAGPSKGDADTPIGKVFIAIATPKGSFASEFMMGNHRERVVQKSVHKAFELLEKEILKF